MSVINKIASLLLIIVFGISVLIIAFFYFGENLIDVAAYESKKQKIEAPENYQEQVTMSQQEVAVVDSLASDSITETIQVVPVIPQKPSKPVVVEFSFLEKLIYYKTDIAMGWAYLLVLITLVLALVFPLIYMFSNPQNMIRTLGILAAAALMVGIAFMLSSDTPIYIPGFDGTDNSDPGVLRFVDTAMFTTYFLIGLALISILYSEVAKYFK